MLRVQSNIEDSDTKSFECVCWQVNVERGAKPGPTDRRDAAGRRAHGAPPGRRGHEAKAGRRAVKVDDNSPAQPPSYSLGCFLKSNLCLHKKNNRSILKTYSTVNSAYCMKPILSEAE